MTLGCVNSCPGQACCVPGCPRFAIPAALTYGSCERTWRPAFPPGAAVLPTNQVSPMIQTAPPPAQFDWPLMRNNIAREDLDAAVRLLQGEDPILTQSSNVRAFEKEWSAWL